MPRRKNGETKELILLSIEIFERQGIPSTILKLAEKLKCTPRNVNSLLQELAYEGRVDAAEKGLFSDWKLTETGREALRIPRRLGQLYYSGAIAAGPALHERESGLGDVLEPSGLDPRTHSVYEVKGTSMEHLHICQGDWAIFRMIDTSISVRVGDVVAIRVPEGTDVTNLADAKKVAVRLEDSDLPNLDHITMKEITSADQKGMTRSAYDGGLMLSATGAYGTVRAPAYQIIGVLVKIERDIRNQRQPSVF